MAWDVSSHLQTLGCATLGIFWESFPGICVQKAGISPLNESLIRSIWQPVYYCIYFFILNCLFFPSWAFFYFCFFFFFLLLRRASLGWPAFPALGVGTCFSAGGQDENRMAVYRCHVYYWTLGDIFTQLKATHAIFCWVLPFPALTVRLFQSEWRNTIRNARTLQDCSAVPPLKFRFFKHTTGFRT